ncbi:unnamed protein product [Chrysoparadoxa australica]
MASGKGGKGVTVLCLAVASVSGLASYLLLRRFRRCYRQSSLLRSSGARAIDPAKLQEGSYVRLKGRVKLGKGQQALQSPVSSAPCVMYKTSKIRVVEQRKRTKRVSRSVTAGAATGKPSASMGSIGLRGGGGVIKTGTEKSTEKWGVVDEPVAVNQEAIAFLLEDMAGTGAVRLDVSNSPEYFTLKTIHEDFEPLEGGGSTSSDGRKTLGFKTVEQVLAVNQELLVFGEVAQDHDKEGGLVIRQPQPLHLFDLKTTGILKPWVVTSCTEAEVLGKVEGKARVSFFSGLALGIVGLASAGIGVREAIASIERDKTTSFT